MTIARLLESAVAATLRGPALEAYAYTALHHAFLDECTRRRREHTSDAHLESSAHGPSPEQTTMASASMGRRATALAAVLGRLDPRDVTFLRLCIETGSAPEAQRQGGWPPGGTSAACEKRNRLVARLRREGGHE